MHSRHYTHVAKAIVLVLAACGGSSTKPAEPAVAPIAVTFQPTPFTASFAQGSFVPPTPLNVSLSRLPDVPVSAAVVQDKPVLAGTTIAAFQVGTSNTFATSLTPSCQLSPGSYTGNLTLLLCTDPACSAPLPITGNVLPYSFQVAPGHVMTAKVAGAAVAGLISQCTASFFSATVGKVVDLVSSLPVTWQTSVGTSAGVPVVSGVTTTSTTWSGTVSERDGNNIPGVEYGAILVHATPESGPTLSATIFVVGG